MIVTFQFADFVSLIRSALETGATFGMVQAGPGSALKCPLTESALNLQVPFAALRF